MNGPYFVRRRAAQPSAVAGDVETVRHLWEVSEELVGCPSEPAS